MYGCADMRGAGTVRVVCVCVRCGDGVLGCRWTGARWKTEKETEAVLCYEECEAAEEEEGRRARWVGVVLGVEQGPTTCLDGWECDGMEVIGAVGR